MKETILRLGKIILPAFIVGLYMANFIDVFNYATPSPPPTTILSLTFSILFFLSYIFLLWICRKSRRALRRFLAISCVCVVSAVIAWYSMIAELDLTKNLFISLIYILPYVPFKGFSFFITSTLGYNLLFTTIVFLLFALELFWFIRLRRKTDKKT